MRMIWLYWAPLLTISRFRKIEWLGLEIELHIWIRRVSHHSARSCHSSWTEPASNRLTRYSTSQMGVDYFVFRNIVSFWLITKQNKTELGGPCQRFPEYHELTNMWRAFIYPYLPHTKARPSTLFVRTNFAFILCLRPVEKYSFLRFTAICHTRGCCISGATRRQNRKVVKRAPTSETRIRGT